MNFDQAFNKLLAYEGGYSFDKNDPGGETMYGITLNTARQNGYKGEMRKLPIGVAKTIARKEYWDKAKIDELPEEIKFDVFDTAYHSGINRAIRLLQKSLEIQADGDFGPLTAKAILEFDDAYRLKCRYNGHRLDFVNDLRNWNEFSRGWSQRIAQNLIRS